MREETYGDMLICPYCGCVDKNCWELGGGEDEDGETDCGSCGKTFVWHRDITVEYTGKPMPEQVEE